MQEIDKEIDESPEQITESTDNLDDEVISQDDDENFELALLPPEERENRRTASRPDISWLVDAVQDEKFIPKRNEYLVMERKMILSDERQWLDTKVYRLLSDPNDKGDIKMIDVIQMCNCQVNWRSALEYGFVLKLPPTGRNPETLFLSHGARRRKKKFSAPKAQVTSTVELNVINKTNSNVDKPRGRGRPAGSKNRSREEIDKSKAEYRQKLREKRERRRK